MDSKKVEEARLILGLPAEATRTEIDQAYRKLVQRVHPDRYDQGRKADARRRMAQATRAYRILRTYVEQYLFPLDEERVRQQNPGEAYGRFHGYWHDGTQ